MTILAVAVGGALGAVARYGISGWLHAATGWHFPIGTLAVNVAGSFIIGAALGAALERPELLSAHARLLLTTGFCGSLTTYSTFSYETVTLLEGQQWLAAGGSTALNLVLSVTATYLGIAAVRAFTAT